MYFSNDNIHHSASFLLIFLNIPIITSALTASEESLRLHQSALLDRKMNAAKTDFLAKMSHELRTPRIHVEIQAWAYLFAKTCSSYIKAKNRRLHTYVKISVNCSEINKGISP